MMVASGGLSAQSRIELPENVAMRTFIHGEFQAMLEERWNRVENAQCKVAFDDFSFDCIEYTRNTAINATDSMFLISPPYQTWSIELDNLIASTDIEFSVTRGAGREVLDTNSHQAIYRMVNSELVTNAEAILRSWTDAANSHEVFGCDREATVCRSMYHAFTRNAGSDNRALAVCEVAPPTDDGTLGPPSDCRPVWLDRGDSQYFLALVYFDFSSSLLAAAGRRDATILVEMDGQTDLEIVEAVIQAALEAEPLQLEVAAHSAIIRGYADYRFLPEQGIWTRQTVNIIRIDDIAIADRVFFAYELSTTLYVSKQNSSENRHWRLPEEEIHDWYLRLFRSSLETQLSELCEQHQLEEDVMGESFLRLACSS
jgi:hypothetical protein